MMELLQWSPSQNECDLRHLDFDWSGPVRRSVPAADPYNLMGVEKVRYGLSNDSMSACRKAWVTASARCGPERHNRSVG